MKYPRKIDWDNYLIHCHALPSLVPLKSFKLTIKGKSILDAIWLKETWGIKSIVYTDAMEKGILKEPDSIALYRKVFQIFTTKNVERKKNKYLSGEADILRRLKVVDIKTCRDAGSYISKDAKKAESDHLFQLVGYAMLYNKKKGQIAYTLLSNSEEMIQSEYEKSKWKLRIFDDETPEAMELYEQVQRNNIYEDIPEKQRIKVYDFDINSSMIERVELTVINARAYLKSKRLNT